MRSVFKVTILLLCLQGIGTSQEITHSKYDEMINAFILGLDQKGIEIGHEIISKQEYEEIRENSLIWLADFYFNDFLIDGELNFTAAERSYTLYSMVLTDYPTSQLKGYVLTRLALIESFFYDLSVFGNKYLSADTEMQTIRRKFQISDLYFKSGDVDVLAKYEMLLDTNSKFSTAIAYIDAIIVNHPEYEIYGYYQKIMLLLSIYDRWSLKEALIQSGIDKDRKIDSSVDKLFGFHKIIASEVVSYLQHLDNNYPSAQLTLEAHFMFSAYIWNDEKNFASLGGKSARKKIVRQHLEYIMKNDPDKLGIRYILAKEFIIKNL